MWGGGGLNIGRGKGLLVRHLDNACNRRVNSG